MGQKTHPVGYRLIVNKKWNSNWFASKNDFSSDLEEDMKIRKYVSHRLSNAGISKVEIARSSKKVTVTIFTARPGIVIGRGGEEVNQLKKELRQLTGKKDAQINISEIKRIVKSNGVITAQVGSKNKKPRQVDSWLKTFDKACGNCEISEIFIPSFDCSWNFISSINR